MNYQKHYDLLIERARTRVISGYIEKHHVIPRCLGGSNSPENIVRLTPEEHYLAHQILVKLHPHSMGLLGAALLMSGERSPFTHRSNKTYGWLRRRFSKMMTGRKKSPEAIEKIAVKNRGKVRSEAFKAAVREFHSGRKRAPETGKKISASHKIRCNTPEFKEKMSVITRGRKMSPEACANMSAAMKGRIHSEDTKAKMSAAKIGKKKSAETKRRMGIARRRTAAEKAKSGLGNKLSAAQVHSIRKDARALRVIAAEYGMSHHYICRIRTGKVQLAFAAE